MTAKLLACLPLSALLAACGAETPPPAIQIKTVEKIVEVQRPCPVTVPQRPAPLPKQLPSDLAQLAALLGAKLAEWSGPGKYGERADAALHTCTKE